MCNPCSLAVEGQGRAGREGALLLLLQRMYVNILETNVIFFCLLLLALFHDSPPSSVPSLCTSGTIPLGRSFYFLHIATRFFRPDEGNTLLSTCLSLDRLAEKGVQGEFFFHSASTPGRAREGRAHRART